ncbi:MAG TPA: TetR family transcriptional regulator [Micromonosporaceae bacterium]
MNSPGLRERKKRKTRWAIQDHALRLFAEQGYEATTVDQIAAAAEISPSTFFRYFKTKEDLVVEDEYDALLAEGVRTLRPDLEPLAAIREVMRSAFRAMGAQERAKVLERAKLIMSVPALRARSMQNFLNTVALVREAAAERTGRPVTDFELRAFAGAVVGALVGVLEAWIESGDPDELPDLMDRALAYLGAGLPL